MIKEFEYSFEELEITNENIEELLGFEGGIIPEPFPELIQKALSDAPQFCKIKGGYQIFDSINIDIENNRISINEQIFSPTKIVVTQLKKATSLVLFVCTAGADISKHSKQISDEGDPLLSYVFDVIGSVTVEKAMDKIQKSLESETQKSGLSISDRYSPGYCEWSVAEQQKLFKLLPKDFCGIILSNSSLMTPIKSVSGIIGIGTDLKQKGYQCHWCTDINCFYGKIKRREKAKI